MLAPEFADDQIARILSRKRLKTGTGLPFNAQRVTNVHSTCNIAGKTRAKLEVKDIYTAQQSAEILGESHPTVIIWIETGFLVGTQLTVGAPWRVRLTEADRRPRMLPRAGCP